MKVTGNPEAHNGTWEQIKLEDLEQERSEVRKTVEKKTTPKKTTEKKTVSAAKAETKATAGRARPDPRTRGVVDAESGLHFP